MKIEQSNIASLPTKYGKFKIKAYKEGNQEHLAIMSLDFKEIETPYVRIHSECLTGDTLGSLKCDCQNQLDLAMRFIAKEGGLIIYHRQEGRNIGLLNKVNAYALQDQGRNTIEANLELGFKEDERDYKVIGHIFKDLGIKKIKLITNNPKKIEYVESLGINIEERIPAITKINKYNEHYLNTKKNKMGHLL
ncbi:GTP cyclohydrolase II [Malaciobacter mytili LMG 24559]|nr:GTP cyclohydrolase II [Malaciobacter mytili]AXH15016.1 GTP cyclohydrolase II [Malaciobacter mytili LMG 24559]